MPKLTNKELQLILQEGEGYKIEFKENSSGGGIKQCDFGEPCKY